MKRLEMKKSEKKAYRRKIKGGSDLVEHGPALRLINDVMELCVIEEVESLATNKRAFILLDILYPIFQDEEMGLDKLDRVRNAVRDAMQD